MAVKWRDISEQTDACKSGTED